MSALQLALVVVMIFGVALTLMTATTASAGDHAQRDAKLEHKLKAISRANMKMDEQLSRLLIEVKKLQQKSAHGTDVPSTSDVSSDAAVSIDEDRCPDRRPYHTVLTATGSNYQQWQSRIMYHHWKKQRAAGGECSDMAAFTRLCATRGGVPDGLENEIPTLFTVELSAEVLNSHFGFGVLNRPNSVKQLMESATLLKEIRKTSDYVLILETDHVIMKPIPNLATPTKPAAFVFGYMYPQRSQDWVIKKYWPEGDYSRVQPVGPSPVLIHLDQLKLVYQKWLDFSLDLRSNSKAESVIQGWVQEMWGYSIAAASVGIEHKLIEHFQVEPGALSTRAQLADFSSGRFYIFHYTYQVHVTMYMHMPLSAT